MKERERESQRERESARERERVHKRERELIYLLTYCTRYYCSAACMSYSLKVVMINPQFST